VRVGVEMLPSVEMRRWILRLLDPAPTSPFNPFYGRHDNRSVGQQVASGLRLASGLVGGFLTLAVAFGSISILLADAQPDARSGHSFFWVVLCFASILMFLTVNRWVAFVPAFYCLTLFRILSALLVGRFISSSAASSWSGAKGLLELLVACAVVTALNWRFVGHTPVPTTLLDRFALTFFVLAQLSQMAITYRWPPLPLTSGLCALLIAWGTYQWKRGEITRKHRTGSPTISETLPRP